MRLFTTLYILFTLFAFSAHAEFSGFVGIGDGTLKHQAFERTVSLGWVIHPGDAFFVKPEIGGWIGGFGMPSYFVGVPLGFQVWIPATGAFCHMAVGPSWISNPDSELSSHLQFDTEFGFGLQSDKAEIGLIWKHFSNAGLKLPNQGRDFLGLQLRVKGF